MSERWLRVYRDQPLAVEEHANIELAAAEGGYGRRQLYELIQNGADALIAEPGGKVQIILTADALYCANEGLPIDADGVDSLLTSHVSRKRGPEIGRFGLGFKSVLEITDQPRFFSRTASFGWDAALAEEQIRAIVPDAPRTPKLRLAYPLDACAEAKEDPVLAELMAWATTVVKLPCDPDGAGWLAADIASFPREFLLFSKHVGRLILENRTHSDAFVDLREIRLQSEGGRFVLSEDGSSSVWKVYSTVYKPSREAQKDAGEMSNRVEVPIHWAIPLEGGTRPGLLWAFFPTEYETTLSGIVNAPWKTNPDRKNLLDGVFNTELLVEAAALVVRNLGDLLDADDPGRLLDLMPARGRETRNWADRILTEKVYELAADVPSLADQSGALAVPATLSIHPEGIPQDVLRLWASRPASVEWVHWSVETRERRPRADRLIDLGGGTGADLTAWLEALVSADPSPEASKHAILVAAACVVAELRPRAAIERACVALDASGELAGLDPDSLFLPSEYAAFEGIHVVHPELAADDDLRDAFATLGIRRVDATAELEARLTLDFDDLTYDQWAETWSLLRSVGYAAAREILSEYASPWVCVKDGSFRPIPETLLPGPVVPEDGSRDAAVTIDVGFHENDLRFLAEIGAVSAPTAGRGSWEEHWFSEYRSDAAWEFVGTLTGGRNPQRSLLDFRPGRSFAGPLEPLGFLGDEGRAAFTQALLAAETDFAPWEFGHTTRPDAYPTTEFPCPAVWMTQREGRLETTRGIVATEEAVASALAEWEAILPVGECSASAASALVLPSSLDELDEDQMRAAWEACAGRPEATVSSFYGAMAIAGVRAPDQVVARVGGERVLEEPSHVTVVVDERALEALAAVGTPVIRAASPDHADALVENWGMIEGGTQVRTDVVATPTADEIPLGDLYPPLRHLLTDDQRALGVIRCSDLSVETVTEAGKTAASVAFHFDGQRLYWSQELGDEAFLSELGRRLALSLTDQDVEAATHGRLEVGKQQKILQIRRCESLEERLVAAVGVHAIRRHLPEGVLRALDDGRLADARLAELALAVYGFDVLKEFQGELAEQGFAPPATWSGSSPAIAFARRLGFPREYAGFESARRPPLLEVDGPVDLKPLHDFQQTIVGEVRRLIRGEGGWRGLIALPTGAGKTRVAVQALIEAIKAGDVKKHVLWVAQSDELNEQAVQTWADVWRTIGPADRLSISRLWDTNEAEPVQRGAHVVVATIDKLQGCVDDREYKWLAKPACVVIDEAHHAITPSYTKLLDWIGAGRGKGERPVLGLTATPFRGVSEAETVRLVRRFGGRRLDSGAFDGEPYAALQEMGVLAHVRYRVLKGAKIELSGSELEQLKRLRRLPPQAEERLGLDSARNMILIEEIKRLPKRSTAILFATSVEHAQTMAALLTLEGIPAKPISGNTHPGARRRYVDAFRRRELRVLTNYNVLTQGFDAPAVEAIYVARPTYSPNLYQQMIGRGLRGPLNGGKDECLIVNVQDNVLQYGEQLAFRQFEHLWEKA